MSRHSFLAFDLGAESGRAVVGHLRAGVLAISEAARFPNTPIRRDDSLRWDIEHLWTSMRAALDQFTRGDLTSIGVDAWGCDYGLLDAHGQLLEPPYHYRDSRTDGVVDRVAARVTRERIYTATGIQFLPFNTLYQLEAAARTTPELLTRASALLTIPDLLNHRLTGRLVSEYTIATTTQMVTAATRTWATDLLEALALPARLLPPLVEPGTVLGPLLASASASLAGTHVVAPACHDTGSAVAAVDASNGTAFLSSGTWSLLGTELTAPVITSRGLDLNFTNEGGVCGTTRLLKNVAGLWLLQSCRRSWEARGHAASYDDLASAADGDVEPFQSLLDPDDALFLHPVDMPTAIDEYCRRTDQRVPAGPAAYTRAILESLAFKYRLVLEGLETLTGQPVTTIRVIGGGARNRVLNQFTADATGREVLAGPVEATALGNIAMQMVAEGAVTSLGEARRIIDRSFPGLRFSPRDTDRWDAHYRRFREYVELTCA